ncbi:MAG: ABC transporter ATP-binding protein [Parvularculaceae bacterium]
MSSIPELSPDQSPVEPQKAAEEKSAAIELEAVSLDLPLRQRSLASLFRRAPRPASDDRIQSAKSGAYVSVLRDVSLRLEYGMRLGLIGVNGAGKSSLLRLMAGIYTPTTGACLINGKVSTLFANTIGMNEQASGRENIYLSARTLGLSKREIEEITPEVIEFADLGDFIDLPLRVYSAGMKTRLGFGVATSIKPEILLIDEVFGVGDQAFRERAQKRIHKVMGDAGSMVLATHSINILREFCDTICWIDRGRMKFFGDVKKGLRQYTATGKKLG